jgi:hypothetical protein
LKRNEAIAVIKELLEGVVGLDGHSLELAAPISSAGGYQIVIKGSMDEKTISEVESIVAKHQLATQIGNIWKTRYTLKEQPDTLIIYKPKNKA